MIKIDKTNKALITGRHIDSEIARLREEVNAGYIKRINHELSDEEATAYQDKDRLLFAIDKANFKNETI